VGDNFSRKSWESVLQIDPATGSSRSSARASRELHRWAVPGAAGRFLTRALLFLGAYRHLGLVFPLFALQALLGARFDLRLRLGDGRQAQFAWLQLSPTV